MSQLLCNFKSEKTKISSTLRGLFAPKIPYEIRNPSGDWTPYYGKWESQKRNGLDLNVCWSFAGTECMETQLQFLLVTKRFPQETVDWLKANGYIDEDGDVYLSRRFIPILSGVTFNGNDEAEHWRLASIYGMIPNKMLPYTENEYYFDTSKITQAMYDLGKEFLKRVQIQYEELGTRFTRRDIHEIRAALFQAPLQIGIPIPQNVDDYNLAFVQWDGSTQAKHSVEVRKVDEKDQVNVMDQYNPFLKTLSADYFIPIITRGVLSPRGIINPNPISQTTLGAKIWRAIWQYFFGA